MSATACKTCSKIKPLCACPAAPTTCTLNLDASEMFLFDLWSNEHTTIAGTDIEFWSLDIGGSLVDPLYGEAIERRWNGPYRLKAWVQMPQDNPEPGQSGTRTVFEGAVWIPRAQFEQNNAPTPNENDIIRLWNIPFFKGYAVDDEIVPGSGFFFDVTNVNHDGHVFDQASFVGFSLDLARRTDHTPERRLQNQ